MLRDRILNVLYKIEILVLVTTPLCAVVIAIFYLWNSYVFTTDLVLFAVFFAFAMFGVTIGYHRYLTHQGFECGNILKLLLVIVGTTAFEGRPLDWVPTHIKHHAHSDDDGDPHSPLHGFFHAHMGWIFNRHVFARAEDYAPHLLKDPVIVWADRWYLLWMALSLAIPYAIGGWTALVWAGGVRIFLSTHITYSVNSICHTFGRRTFETNDESRNEWVIGLLAFGEGWHNNHHAFPRNAFHGMRWWQFDLSGLLIRGLEATGLVWNVQRVSDDFAVAQRTRMQAMRESMAGMRQGLLTSLSSMRSELAGLPAKLMPEQPLTDTQWAQCEAFQQEAMRRLDVMMQSLSASTIVKRQKLLQYQKEAQKLVQEAKQRWAVATGRAMVS